MMQLKSVLKHINMLNLMLASFIVVFTAYAFPPLLRMKVSYAPPAPRKTAEEKQEPQDKQVPSLMEFVVISEQNLFHPERKIPADKTAEESKPKPEFVLYGTLITGDTNLAFMEDLKAPFASSGRGKRQRALHIGNSISGYTLTEVHPERVLLVKGDDRIEVAVYDPSHPKRHETAAAPASAAKAPEPQKKVEARVVSPSRTPRQPLGQPPGTVDDAKALKEQLKALKEQQKLERRR